MNDENLDQTFSIFSANENRKYHYGRNEWNFFLFDNNESRKLLSMFLMKLPTFRLIRYEKNLIAIHKILENTEHRSCNRL